MRRMVEVTLLRSGVPHETLIVLSEDAVWTYFYITMAQKRVELESAQLSGGL